MAKVFITGGTGFIGAHTARVLSDMGEEVIAFDSFSGFEFPTSPTFVENIEYRLQHLLHDATIIKGSLEHKARLQRYLKRILPEYVIHLAAMPNAGTALNETEEAFQAIVVATVNLLEALCELDGIRKFVYVSSSMIYGDFTKVPMPENGEKDPKEIYGSMKLAAEILAKGLCRRFAIPYAIVRPSAVYGPTNNNRSVLKIFVEKAVRGEPITVTNPETTFLDFTYVKDLARGLALITESAEAVSGEFNLTYGECRSLGHVVGILRRLFPDLMAEIKVEPQGFRPNRGTLDISRAQRFAGYSPRYPLEEGLAEYVAFVHENNPSLFRQQLPMSSAEQPVAQARRTRSQARIANA